MRALRSSLSFSRQVLSRNAGCAHGFQRACAQQRRSLHLHEYQSMRIMQQYGVMTPQFAPAATPEEAFSAATQLSSAANSEKQIPQDFVIKAQVLSGGRGRGYFKETHFQGGVHICTDPAQVKEYASKMLGSTLVTKQTGEAGKPCNTVLVAERFYIRRERYVAILMDRAHGCPILLGSSIGGTSIEEIAEAHPECIVKMPITDLRPPQEGGGPTDAQIQSFVSQLGLTGPQAQEAAESIKGLYKMFIEKDCLLVEVNPFAETHDGRVLVCDAKVSFDDNAAFRQKDVFAQQDHSQEDSREVAAAKFDLNYVGLDGDIGCMVNGAGLAMATMDILQLHGGKPANFLDVGGGANNTQVMEAMRILKDDPNVNAIFVNIFGGIMRCDTIAQGLIEASRNVGLTKPMIVRLEGTKKQEALQLLANEKGMPIISEADFSEAAKKAVRMSSIVKLAKDASLNVTFAS